MIENDKGSSQERTKKKRLLHQQGEARNVLDS